MTVQNQSNIHKVKGPSERNGVESDKQVEVITQEAAIQELKRKKTRCTIQTVISYPIMVIGLTTLFFGLAILSMGSGVGVIVLAVGILLTWLAVTLRRKARKEKAINGDLLLTADSRPPVVYLRSFERDEQEEKYAREQAQLARKVGTRVVGPAGALGGLVTYETKEESLARVLRYLGPFVAIGRPGEPEPKLGASRVYTTDDTWQDKVAEWTNKAGLVYVDLSTARGKGVWWEMKYIFEHCPLDRIVLYFPWNKAIWETLQERIPRRIAEKLPEEQPRVFGGVHLSFRPDGTPEVLKPSFWSLFGGQEQLYISTFKPVFQRLGQRGPRMGRVLILICVAAGFMTVLVVSILLLSL